MFSLAPFPVLGYLIIFFIFWVIPYVQCLEILDG
jgi:hypothetical protein